MGPARRTFPRAATDALGFLRTAQLVAVLPAYLEILVERGLESMVPGTLTLILRSPHAGADDGLGQVRFAGLFASLEPAQRDAVGQALRYFADLNPGTSLGDAARDALESAWAQPR